MYTPKFVRNQEGFEGHIVCNQSLGCLSLPYDTFLLHEQSAAARKRDRVAGTAEGIGDSCQSWAKNATQQPRPQEIATLPINPRTSIDWSTSRATLLFVSLAGGEAPQHTRDQDATHQHTRQENQHTSKKALPHLARNSWHGNSRHPTG